MQTEVVRLTLKQRYPLFTIPKHPCGAAGNMAQNALPGQAEIASWWEGTLPIYRRDAVIKALGDIHERDQWIACSCTDNPSDPPLLGPVIRNGMCSLRRLTERAAHARNCIFEFEMKELGSGDEKTLGQVEAGDVTQPNFLIESRVTGLATPRAISEAHRDSGTGEKLDPLAHQLFWLLRHCELDRVPGRKGSPVSILLTAAKVLPLKKKGLKLSDLLYCNSMAWTEGWMDTAFEKCERVDAKAQSILVCPVFGSSRKESWVTLQPEGGTVPISGRLAIYGDDDSPVRYPMLMFAQITRKKGQTPVISRAYLHPMKASAQWLLVDSDYERKALDTIFAAQQILAKRNLEISIHKPLFNWNCTEARPDFVLQGGVHATERTLVIETMGSADPDYQDRKRRTVQRLDGFVVFEDKRYEGADHANARLLRFIIGYFSGPRRMNVSE
jgi:hypothetical protein